jgi:uncharacterized protein YjbI with pentapeptide repeats
MDAYLEDQTFEKLDAKTSPLAKGGYDHCSFVNCDLASANLSEIKFIDCRFSGCNLSMASVSAAVFREVEFTDCKMMGILFNQANKFGLSARFEGCILDHSSFYQAKIKKTNFLRCQLKQVDFTGCDLTGSVFEACDLSGAVFENTLLEKADLRGATGYTIDPETNRIRTAKFSLAGLPGLLAKYGIEISPLS